MHSLLVEIFIAGGLHIPRKCVIPARCRVLGFIMEDSLAFAFVYGREIRVNWVHILVAVHVQECVKGDDLVRV
jgi:hypothetical protein